MPPPKRTIRFCVNNTTSLAEREQLLSAGCEVRDCLGRCSQCFDRRFVAVGKQIIEGDTYDAILEKAQRIADPETTKLVDSDNQPNSDSRTVHEQE